MNTKNPTLGELMDALPARLDGDNGQTDSAGQELQQRLSQMGGKPLPMGRFTRLWAVGTLQARIVLPSTSSSTTSSPTPSGLLPSGKFIWPS